MKPILDFRFWILDCRAVVLVLTIVLLFLFGDLLFLFPFPLFPVAPGACYAKDIEPHHLNIDATATFQTIDNFGASDCWSMQKIGAWSDANKNGVADLLFSMDKGIGLSCWRFNFGGGLNTNFQEPWRKVDTFEVSEGVYDWTRQANERWFLRAAKARGVPQFLAFVNSPPGRMTRNGFTRCTRDVGTTNLKEGYAPQFARYLADILKHFRDNPDEAERIDFNYVSPVNEPHLGWNNEQQEGNRASNEDIKVIVNALYDALHKQGLRAEISVPECNNYTTMCYRDPLATAMYGASYGKYIDALCGDSSINTKIGKTVCAHAYWSDREDAMVSLRQAVRREMDKHPGWKFWQSEYCAMSGPKGESGSGRDLTMRLALWVARLMYCDLTVLNASAWHWWTAVSHCDYKDGLIYTDYSNPGDAETIIPSKLLWAFGNYSRFVRPGMIRIDLKGADDIHGLMASAYTDKDKKKLVVVLVNMKETPASILFDLKESFNEFTPYVTSDAKGDDLKPYPAFLAKEAYSIPPRSVVTLVGN